MSSQRQDRLSIGRVRLEVTVPWRHPAPDRIGSQLDEAVRRAVRPGAFAPARLPPGVADGVWLLRRLSFQMDAAASRKPDHVARQWRDALLRKLFRRLAVGGDGELFWYPSRSDYLAQFLDEMAAGTAWTRWYFTSFAGLRMLPDSAALRTAILEDPSAGCRALAALPTGRVAAVVQALGAKESRRVLDSFDAASPEAPDATRSWRAVGAAYCRARRSDLTAAGPCLALLLGIRALRVMGGLWTRGLAACACAVATLHDQSLKGLVGLGVNLREADDHAAAVGSIEGDDLRSAMSAISAAPLAVRRRLARALTSGPNGGPVPKSRDSLNVRTTGFGGVFLLLPLLDELPLDEATGEWPRTAGGRPLGLWRLLILAKACGPRALACFHDPLVREVAGADPELTREQVCELLQQVQEGARASFTSCLTQWTLDRCSAPCAEGATSKDPDESVEGTSEGDEYLRLPCELADAAARPADATLGLATRTLLRLFARQLPGLSRASLPYLFDSFLDFEASLESRPDARVVYLGRPAINVILSITGKNRARYSVSWLDARPFVLFQE